MSFIYKAWNDFFFSNHDFFSMAIFRIFLGVSILTLFVASFPNWERFYSSNGMVSLNDPSLKKFSLESLSIFHYLEPIVSINSFWWLGIIFSITFTLGLFTRLSTVILFILIYSMFIRNPFIAAGYDVVFKILLFFSCFTPLNYCLAIDNLFVKKVKALPSIWPIRLMQISIASIYLITSLRKLLADPAWLNGEAVYWVAISKSWSVFPYPEILYKWDGFLSKLLTYATILIEILFPLLVWFRKTRVFIVLVATLFHIFLFIVIPDILIFSMVMISSFWAFVPASDSYRLITLLKTLRLKL